MNEIFRGAGLVVDQRIGDARFVRQFPRAVMEERGQRLFPLKGRDEGFRGLGDQRLLGMLDDHLVGIVGKDNEDFGAVRGLEMQCAGADGQFAFARGAPGAKLLELFRGEGFHWVMASGLCDSN